METLDAAFAQWRRDGAEGWGLAWYLATQFCRRFYASHGIVPTVIAHDGLGYYGIKLSTLPCGFHASSEDLGRLTMEGDIEDWRRGSPPSHRLPLHEMCTGGTPTPELVRRALAHLDLPTRPAKPHLTCRHKRWGASYELCFALAATLAMRTCEGSLQIWNDPALIRRQLEAADPQAGLKEHPGAFLFVFNGRQALLRGDGQLLGQTPRDLWDQYMKGADLDDLSSFVLDALVA